MWMDWMGPPTLPYQGLDGATHSPVPRKCGWPFRPVLRTAEQEQFARPGARDQVDEAVAVNVHQLWTEPDASPRGDAALGPAVLEFLARCEPRVSGRPLVAIDPEDSLSEPTDKKVHDAIAVEVAHEGRGVADVSID